MVNRPTFLAFETAKRAIANSQLGLDTVGHNMSNINTPGYTRQRVDQVSWSITGMPKYVINKSFFPGMGAKAIGISQIRDPLLDARYRAESSDFGEYVVEQNGLTDLKNIFDEYKAESGLTLTMGELIDSITKSMQDPTNVAYAMVVRAKAEEFAKTLNMYSKDLTKVLNQNHEDAAISIDDEINPMLKELAVLNEQIFQMEVYGNPANELKDRRNLLLDELSGFLDLEVKEVADQNLIREGIYAHKVTISIRGSVCGSNPGPMVLVDHDKAGEFKYDRIGDKLEFQLSDPKTGTTHGTAEMEVALQTGALRGYLDFINGDGVGSNPRGIPFAMDYLNTLAQTFAEVMNTVNGNQTWDDGTGTMVTGGLLITNSADNTVNGITAANIAISAEWAKDAYQIILGYPSNDSFDTTPAAQFIDALETQKHGPIIEGQDKMDFHEAIVAFQGVIGLDLMQTTNLLSTSNKVLNSLDEQRQSLSGVSENEEAIDMMTYSNHYNAAVRYMTTLDEALDTIINGMGRVGR